MNFKKNKLVSLLLVFALALFTSGIFPKTTSALSLVNAKDTMSSQAMGATSDHTITWTLASGHTTALNATIAIHFTAADFVTSGTWQTTGFAFSDNVRSSAAPAAVGTGAQTCTGSGANNYIVNVNAGTSTFTITTCTGWTTSAAATATTFVIKGATGGTGTLTNKSSNVESSIITITDGVNDTDSTSLSAVVETNDVVTVSATVNPTLTLAISSATVALPTLTTSSTGTGSHTAQIATNAAGGFLLTYNGTTLTSGVNTIAAYGSQATPTAGTAGFGINMVSNSSPSVGAGVTQNGGTCAALPADYGTTNKFSFVASTTTPLTNQAAPADCTYTISYVANISSVTPAGSYTAPITYIASGTF